MSPHRIRWLVFLSCGGILALALAWVTWIALDIEERGHQQRVQNAEIERLNTALARMDSALTTVLAREASRPPSHYAAFFEPGKAYTRDFQEIQTEGVLLPSPLLTERPELFKVYFSIDPSGGVTSPSLPVGEMRTNAEAQGLLPEDIDRTSQLLRELNSRLSREKLLAALGRMNTASPAVEEPATLTPQALVDPGPEERRQNLIDGFRARSRLMAYANVGQQSVGDREVTVTGFLPIPVANRETGQPDLLFVREVYADESRFIQGIWSDWNAMHEFLIDEVRALYPGGRLRPAENADPTRASLASIPYVFETGPQPVYELPTVTATRLALLGLWVALLVAAFAVGITFWKTLELSERRRGFVSAVTHELRTPLTTFCMYSEMLADGMVTDEIARAEYLDTLKTESVRLRRIVDNVLDYARLEGRKPRGQSEVLSAEALVDRVLPTLERRAAEEALELQLDLTLAPEDRVQVDVQSVEQILFNLVDNACKYGHDESADGERARAAVVLEARRNGRLEVTVLDHGPGVPAANRGAVFVPFRRAAGEAERTTPGIGLGLALSRGMARSMGGDVELVEREGFGAGFRLHLPFLRPS